MVRKINFPCSRMDKKGPESEVVFPDIMFCVDGFEEVCVGLNSRDDFCTPHMHARQ